ncbi:prolyl 4-hydroxylase subunit alpha-1-like [Oratosquilla oratoria]|uniref:prolyl 4-hydroxylase subunit alpha-1-like n=1 Tax=Oratosquilla oratoria TaxID=337810 RepID=UPI003F75CC19
MGRAEPLLGRSLSGPWTTQLLFLVVPLLLQPCPSEGEIFTSTQDLRTTFHLEQSVVRALKDYMAKTEATLGRIRRYLQEYESVVPAVGDDGGASDDSLQERAVDDAAHNPLHAFHLMKRLTVDWQHIFRELQQPNVQGVLDAARMSPVPLPSEEDLHGAAQALVRLQDVYNLNISRLVRGELWGIQGTAELTAQDCLYMGKHSFNLGLYSRSLEWFDQAYQLAGLEGNRTITQGQVVQFLNAANQALETATGGRVHFQLGGTLTSTEDDSRGSSYTLGDKMQPFDEIRNFQALCRGLQLQDDAYVKTLTCWYDDREVPYLRLMPVRVERQHHDPELLVFHQVLSEEEVEMIKTLAKPLLARAMVQGKQGKGHTTSSTRTSKVAWLDDTRHPIIGRIGHRVSLLTGLSTDVTRDDAELLQVSNYGIGGHYNPHHDYLHYGKTPEELNNINPRDLMMGDRTATFMFYLSDVTLGGATAFPRIGAAVWPRKGSAAFWHNIRKNGEGDTRTLHGACPVLQGSKWVSNKWIRSRGQVFTRPCDLNPET